MSPVSSKQRQFDALVRGYSGDLFRYAYWLCGEEALAQDLVQESFLRAWRSLDSLRETGAAKAWLITILRREHARLYERKTPQLVDVDDVEVADDREALTPEGAGEDALIRAAMLKLDVKYREPLLMQVLGGFSCEEIARELNISSAAVMTQLFRARQKLKAILGGEPIEAQVYELR
ncbi:MAG: sigma-70 family RNA polymerase sigma factor [Rudaea sp.]|uniref:sigma-70 family RNA polymerase sigma factor n=1 Tax=unclassified Rudaea TaxID=2627037 RepID=UPI0010F50586|nr:MULTISPECIES: sigma-70 family RNA polymerase sigma factor [unclassified Rudaea]MBN8886076.1 sigma-70 family RNA polymerase sigma factor [Rudaea sp.]MBR0345887.1 sigma-70 family RNA polymerase sigma factor [Rudaea sp.]